MDEFANQAFAELTKRAEPRLRELMEQHGATTPQDLGVDLAGKLLRQALIETAVKFMPEADIEMMDRGFRLFTDQRFSAAFARAKKEADAKTDVFGFVQGVDAAIVLSGFGLPVAPMDRKTRRLMADPVDDPEAAVKTFAKAKTAFVAYSVTEAPFYALLTDCLQTLRRRVGTDPRLADVKKLVDRGTAPLPAGSGAMFQHFAVLYAREPGDRISTVLLEDPSPTAGSIMLWAGWMEDGEPKGAPNDGFLPVPMTMLRAAMESPEGAMWLTKGPAKPHYLQ